MELTITDLNVGLSNENLSRIRQKTRRMFGKICDSVKAINVTIDDINGPKGGKDKNCRIIIHTKGIPDIVITDNQTSVMSAVNISLSRARMALLRKVKRKQNLKPTWTEKPVEEGLQKYLIE